MVDIEENLRVVFSFFKSKESEIKKIIETELKKGTGEDIFVSVNDLHDIVFSNGSKKIIIKLIPHFEDHKTNCIVLVHGFLLLGEKGIESFTVFERLSNFEAESGGYSKKLTTVYEETILKIVEGIQGRMIDILLGDYKADIENINEKILDLRKELGSFIVFKLDKNLGQNAKIIKIVRGYINSPLDIKPTRTDEVMFTILIDPFDAYKDKAPGKYPFLRFEFHLERHDESSDPKVYMIIRILGEIIGRRNIKKREFEISKKIGSRLKNEIEKIKGELETIVSGMLGELKISSQDLKNIK